MRLMKKVRTCDGNDEGDDDNDVVVVVLVVT